MRGRWGWRWPLALAALAIWGVPGTAGFLARWVLVFPTSLSVAVPLFALILISEALLVAALWQLAMGSPAREISTAGLNADSPQSTTHTRSVPSYFRRLTTVELALTFGLLVVPLLYSGVLPQQWAILMRVPESGVFPSLLSTLAHARRSVWVGLALAGLGGLTLGLLRDRIFARMRGWQIAIVTVVSLEWLYRGFVGVLALAGAVLRYFSMLGEGEGYLGWLLLAGVILWLLLRG
jgi:hypothetical protein